MLIVDNIDYVTDIEEVYSLQNLAKTWADQDVLTVIFVVTHERIVQVLAGLSFIYSSHRLHLLLLLFLSNILR